MHNPKPELFNTLKRLGVYCAQGSQEVFTRTPAITFYVANSSVQLDLGNNIQSQQVEVVVDVWADDSASAARLFNQVEEALRAKLYKLEFSADVPAPEGALYHITSRFSTVLTGT